MPQAKPVRLAAVLLAFLLAACTPRLARDPLAVYALDPGAFGVPVTTFAVVPF